MDDPWDIPWDKDFLEGQKDLMADSDFPAGFFDLLSGKSEEEILARLREATKRLEELMRKIEGINSRLTAIETKIRAMIPKSENLRGMMTRERGRWFHAVTDAKGQTQNIF
ncbi:hypothetical protein SLE2022_267860 [Rubroshorea leprosula]